MQGSSNCRVIPEGAVDRLALTCRETLRANGLNRGELLGFRADHPLVGRHRTAKVGLRDCGVDVRKRPRSSLCDVGACHFANRETVFGLADLFLQNRHLILVQVQQGRIADDIQISSGIQQRVLLGIAQGFTLRQARSIPRHEPSTTY